MSFEPETQFSGFLEEILPELNQRILHYYGKKSLRVESKADKSPVTVADRETEQFLRQEISKRFPDHTIRGEEFEEQTGSSDYSWILDPIDGTKAFITGCPLFGTLIGLLYKGTPVCGSISFPVLNEWVWGNGSVTLHNGTPTRTGNETDLSNATVLTSDPRLVAEYHPQCRFQELWNQAPIARTWGDCFGYFLVATGQSHIMLDPILSPWDLLPLIPVMEGAGARITDWQGNPATHAHNAVACNPILHTQVLEYLRTS